MKRFLAPFSLLILLISCRKHPHQATINYLKNLKVQQEAPADPFFKVIRLIGSQDSLEYKLLMNSFGTEISGNLYIPRKGLFYEFQGQIDISGSFYAHLKDPLHNPVDTLKGYFQQEQVKGVLTSNYDNVLFGRVVPNALNLMVYSLKLTGKSESYPFEPKPSLKVHHTFITPRDTIAHRNLYHSLSQTFFQALIKKDSIYPAMSQIILDYKNKFEERTRTIPKPVSVDSLACTWVKSFEVVSYSDSLVSILFRNQVDEGGSHYSETKTLVYNFTKDYILKSNDLPFSPQKVITHFLYYPRFIRVWEKDKKDYTDIPL